MMMEIFIIVDSTDSMTSVNGMLDSSLHGIQFLS